jgi:hypothetical protein
MDGRVSFGTPVALFLEQNPLCLAKGQSACLQAASGTRRNQRRLGVRVFNLCYPDQFADEVEPAIMELELDDGALAVENAGWRISMPLRLVRVKLPTT